MAAASRVSGATDMEARNLLSFFYNASSQLLDTKSSMRRELAHLLPALLSLVADERVAKTPAGESVQRFMQWFDADQRKAAATTGIVKCGWLRKPAGSSMGSITTHKRWVVLDGGRMMYFMDQSETELRGVVQLKDARVGAHKRLFGIGAAVCFEVDLAVASTAEEDTDVASPPAPSISAAPALNPMNSHKKLYLWYADTEADRDAWIRVIDTAIAGAHAESVCAAWARRFSSASSIAEYVDTLVAFAQSPSKLLLSADWARTHMASAKRGVVCEASDKAPSAISRSGGPPGLQRELVSLPVDSAASSSPVSRDSLLSAASPGNMKLVRVLRRRQQQVSDVLARVAMLGRAASAAAAPAAACSGASTAHSAAEETIVDHAYFPSHGQHSPRTLRAAASPLAGSSRGDSAADSHLSDAESDTAGTSLAAAEATLLDSSSSRPAATAATAHAVPRAVRQRQELLHQAQEVSQLRDDTFAAVAAAEMSSHRRRVGYTPGDRVSMRQLGRDTLRDVLSLDGVLMHNADTVQLISAVMTRIVDAANDAFSALWTLQSGTKPAVGSGPDAPTAAVPPHLLLCSPRSRQASCCNGAVAGIERQLLEYAREVLLCSSRTVLGGDTYDAAEVVFRNADRAMFRPDTAGPIDPVVLTVEVGGVAVHEYTGQRVLNTGAAAGAVSAAFGDDLGAAKSVEGVAAVHADALAPWAALGEILRKRIGAAGSGSVTPDAATTLPPLAAKCAADMLPALSIRVRTRMRYRVVSLDGETTLLPCRSDGGVSPSRIPEVAVSTAAAAFRQRLCAVGVALADRALDDAASRYDLGGVVADPASCAAAAACFQPYAPRAAVPGELCLIYAGFCRAFPWAAGAPSASIQLRVVPFADANVEPQLGPISKDSTATGGAE